ncbi:Aste57867_1386 [Aphanomyces stellatus]|uniref:Aste57867_1386 protein n=1 Tax=Aphanomyces stellatus TaxID=120398 RepID=A0A485K8F5_9STRA|nr:hypothetical protein As57867_001385 [Aphanomyces stellatus]VFT78603.1 Aste57867_1386 [Aphanomyces stellatus]
MVHPQKKQRTTSESKRQFQRENDSDLRDEEDETQPHEETHPREDVEESDEEDDESGVYMSLYFEKGRLGVAVFHAISSKLEITQLVVPQTELTLTVDHLLTQIQPGAVVLSKLNVTKQKILDGVSCHDLSDSSVFIRKHSEFAYLKACKEIEHLHIGAEWRNNMDVFEGSTKREQYKYLSSYFDFESSEMIRSVGGSWSSLPSYIYHVEFWFSTIVIPINRKDDSTALFVHVVEQASLDGIMLLDANTLKALQIFNQEHHPSQVKSWEKSKEGFSLFALLDNTLTKSGKFVLRQWLLKPLTDICLIESRHNIVDFFFNSSRVDMENNLKSFRDAFRILRRIKTMRAKGRDWCDLKQCLSSFLSIRKEFMMCQESKELEIVQRIESLVTLQEISNLMSNVIDFEATRSEPSCVIREGISSELDDAREKYSQIDQILVELSGELNEEWPQLKSATLHFIPRVGYVIRCSSSSTVPPTLQFQFEDDSLSYYKCPKCRHLDENFGDIHGYMLDIQHQLTAEITKAVLEQEQCLQGMIQVVAELDSFMSLATCARNFKFVRPQMCDDVVLLAKEARHPLQELTVESYIPNDVSLSADTGLINILTGQNGSGKSVFLKMVGILQFLAQVGSFVPATEGN